MASMSGPAPAGPERVRSELLVEGRVQGVGFRYYARRQAQALGLGGFARNLLDGRVAVEVEGPHAAVVEFIGRIRLGPAGAVVRRVDDRWIPPRGEEAFRVE